MPEKNKKHTVVMFRMPVPEDWDKTYNWPMDMPLPSVGDMVEFGDKGPGIVTSMYWNIDFEDEPDSIVIILHR